MQGLQDFDHVSEATMMDHILVDLPGNFQAFVQPGPPHELIARMWHIVPPDAEGKRKYRGAATAAFEAYVPGPDVRARHGRWVGPNWRDAA